MNAKRNITTLIASGLLALSSLLPMAAQAGDHGAPTKAFTYAMDDNRLEWMNCPAFFAKGCQLAILQGDPSKPNSDVIFKTPGNYDLPEHWHSSAERMILIAGELDLSYEGQPTINIKPGMYIYGPAKLPHSGRCVSAEPCQLFIAFEGPLDAHEGHGH
ncbi:MAG TPA: hypothetical protein DCR13_03930 [Gammaproteobacteria bacterium]|nr:hypothetical protein [Gammaproteobacteria bacterium]HAU06342.1 hypothetical protein [Gammaproteobacteria bacterium]